LFTFGLLLFAGCVEPSVDNNATNSTIPETNTTPDIEPTMTCEEYCPTVPHVQCVGEWVISGFYPNCECNFECEIDDDVPVDNGQTNGTDVIEEPKVPVTNKNATKLLTEGLSTLRSDFYTAHTGGFMEYTYTWETSSVDLSSGDILFDIDNAKKVRFNDEYSLVHQASGFVIFEDSSAYSTPAYGMAIFGENSTFLDDLGVFYVDYTYHVIDKRLVGCLVSNKEIMMDQEGNYLTLYYFKCNRARDRYLSMPIEGSVDDSETEE